MTERIRFPIAALAARSVACQSKPPCEDLPDGEYVFGDQAFGVQVRADLTAAKDCTFTYSAFRPSRDGVDEIPEGKTFPTGGALTGSDVVLDGDAFWSTCTGALEELGTLAGTCDGDPPPGWRMRPPEEGE